MREAVIDGTLTGEAVGAGTALSVSGLTFQDGGRTLLDGLSVTLPGAGVSVVMGPNGAGKSLFLRLVHGLLEPSHGCIRWGGAKVSPETTRSQALVFQSPVLLRRSVAANVDFALKARGCVSIQRRDALLARVGLRHLSRTAARRLSGGEAQRLQFARALATDPQVLLMDEPTASLDPASTAVIEALVQDAARQGVKVIFVTHDIGQARRLADDVTFLAAGRLVEHVEAGQFFERPESSQARAYLGGHLVI